jgi:hypothetical protein
MIVTQLQSTRHPGRDGSEAPMHTLAHRLQGLEAIGQPRCMNANPFRPRRSATGNGPRWLPQGVFVSRYFARRQTVRWRCIEISLSGCPSRPVRAARSQGRRRLCGSAPRHKCTRRPRSCASGGQAKGGTPSRQRRVSSLRKRNTGREGTASRELKPVSASRAQSFYAPGSIHLGSLPPCPDHAKDPPGIARQSSGDDRGGGRQQQDAPAPVSQPYEEAKCDENAEKSHVRSVLTRHRDPKWSGVRDPMHACPKRLARSSAPHRGAKRRIPIPR